MYQEDSIQPASLSAEADEGQRLSNCTTASPRSAAILVVGLLVFEPNLNLMILTKENVAAQAFVEHIEALELPPSITSR